MYKDSNTKAFSKVNYNFLAILNKEITFTKYICFSLSVYSFADVMHFIVAIYCDYIYLIYAQKEVAIEEKIQNIYQIY